MTPYPQREVFPRLRILLCLIPEKAWLRLFAKVPLLQTTRSELRSTQHSQKALKSAQKKTLRNLRKERAIKNLGKKIVKLTSKGEKEEAKKTLAQFYKSVDKVVKNHLISKNTAARMKSKISRIITASTLDRSNQQI